MHNPQTHNQQGTARTVPGTSEQYDNSTAGQLAHLSEMDDFEIADGEPDINGWDVRTLSGEKIGEVDDLIVDTALMKVRYIEVKLDKDRGARNDRGRDHARGAGDDREFALIPIGSARLDDDKDDVLINLHDEQLQSLPAYVRGSLTRDYETQLLHGFARPDTAPSAVTDQGGFYDGEYFDDRTAFDGRRDASRRDESYLRRRNG